MNQHDPTDFKLTQALCRIYTELLEAAEQEKKEREESGESIVISTKDLWDLYE